MTYSCLSLSCVLILLFGQAVSESNHDNNYRSVEELRLHEGNTLSRVGNVDVVHDADGDIIAGICHVTNFMGFSRVNGGCDQHQATKIYKELAAILMAMDHFNNGNGRIVNEIEGLNDRCPIRFTAEFHDTQYSPNVVVQSLTKILATRDPLSRTDPLPCAVVGARTSSSTKPSAIVSGVYGIPQMSYTATSPDLNDQFNYPLFQRVVPADDAASKAAIKFFKEEALSTHIAVLYIDDAFGSGYNKAFQNEAAAKGVNSRSFPLLFPPDQEDIRRQIQKVKETGYRHVFLIAFSSYIEWVMSEAALAGVAGDDYFWLLGISTTFFSDTIVPKDSMLAKAFTGIGVLPEFGAEPSSPGYRRFVDAWNDLGDDDIEYFNSKVPVIRGVENCFEAESGFFSGTFRDSPGSTAHFAYDTIISMGLGACNITQDNSFFDGQLHSMGIVDATFEGASGIVSIDPTTTSRDPLLFNYAVLNVQPQVLDGDNVTFSTPETMVLHPNEARSGWNIQKNAPFIFSDGTTTPPASLPEYTVTMNYIGNLRIFGFSLCAIILGLSTAFGIWTYSNRSIRVVRSSQPIFLYMICVGTFVLGSVIIPLSFDDEHITQRGADIACMSQPWLASIGFIFAFSALSSKTWRINQLFHHAQRCHRLKLRERDVLVPFFTLMAANLLVLTLWTVYSPLHFVRTNDNGTDQWNRIVSSTGRCVSQASTTGGAFSYLIALGAINLGSIIFANAQAYQARNIHTEYSEARYIALIMMCLLQSWLTGIPVIALVYTIPRAHYVVLSLIVFFTCMAILLTIFVPKIIFTREWIAQQKDHARKVNDSALRALGSLREEDSTGDFIGAGLQAFRADSIVGAKPFRFDSSSRATPGSDRKFQSGDMGILPESKDGDSSSNYSGSPDTSEQSDIERHT